MSAAAPSASYTATVLSTVEEARQVAAAFLRRRAMVAFDTETTGLNPRTCKLVAIQLKQGERGSVVFDVRDRPEVVRALAPIFEELVILGHNLKFDLGFLRAHGIRARRVFDTQLAEQLIHGVGLGEAADAGKPVNLEATAARYKVAVSKLERNWFIDLDARPQEWTAPFPPEQVAYMAQDVEVLPPIALEQKKQLLQLGLVQVTNIEMRCLLALVEMEHAGIRIDVDGWRAFIAEKEGQAKRLENEVLAVVGAAILRARIADYDREYRQYENYRAALRRAEQELREEYEYVSKDGAPDGLPWGKWKQQEMAKWRANHTPVTKPKLDTSPPNLDSAAQLIVGFEALGVAVPTKKNERGVKVKTTESKSLETLGSAYPVIKLFLEYRKAKKFVTSFGETLLAHVGEDGRIHPEYQQIGAATGRMSCARPNWQQVPSKGDGKRLRELVKAGRGCVLLTADFSNIELRILANLSGDQTMCDAFDAGLDLHSETARRMFALDADVDPKKTVWKRDLTYRQIAKIINFMLVYGGTPFKLAMEIGIEVEEAEALVASYFKAYPGVKRWMDAQRKAVWRDLHSTTVAGRRRPYKDVGPEPLPSWFPHKTTKYGPGMLTYTADYAKLDEAKREWKKQRARVERQAMNSPIQGSSADLTKLACALFVEHCDPKLARLVAVVHDEMVVEAREDSGVLVSLILKDAMKAACDRYLTRSPVPEPEVVIADHWSKD